MMSQGPLVQGLTLEFTFTHRGHYEGPSTISLLDAISPLNGRVHELTLSGSHDHVRKLSPLERLRERL